MTRDSEALRREYNANYSSGEDRWSLHTMRAAMAVARGVVRILGRYGLGDSSGLRLLDVGCAKGHLTEAFRRLGFEAHGLDYSDVAVEHAHKVFPECVFRHMDGFNPEFDERFDVIVCRGFSGTNTHDLDFVAGFSNKYIQLLSPGGFYVLAFNTDWSGVRRSGATACWSREELASFVDKLNASHQGTAIMPSGLERAALKMWSLLRGRTHRDYFYAVFRKESV